MRDQFGKFYFYLHLIDLLSFSFVLFNYFHYLYFSLKIALYHLKTAYSEQLKYGIYNVKIVITKIIFLIVIKIKLFLVNK